jgi:hypothetical protein
MTAAGIPSPGGTPVRRPGFRCPGAATGGGPTPATSPATSLARRPDRGSDLRDLNEQLEAEPGRAQDRERAAQEARMEAERMAGEERSLRYRIQEYAASLERALGLEPRRWGDR